MNTIVQRPVVTIICAFKAEKHLKVKKYKRVDRPTEN